MNKNSKVRKITVTALLGALATILMYLQFSIPLVPSFIKLDFSDFPALIASFTLGPVFGVVVCLIKNLLSLFHTTTGGIGELCNFMLGAFFVFPAGMIYSKNNSKKGAVIGSLVGALVMAILSVFANYFVIYPIYTAFMPMKTILKMYQVINPNVKTLLQALLIFNMPFTFFKGLCDVFITFIIYKRISPIIKGEY